ncbi:MULTISPECIES: CGNR zinc finger domain-containing protein [Prauserella salsuginis group]|uniref:CGNR zinc finger domain-containing protein n=2 Tax=Prauserella salsuginis group TaxID=2893672 RepID=A0ABW6G2H2_9PSEU|nr:MULTISPECIES: ABATE domain-containing protein [Prauserella salsuginis group]MBB3662167.1 putative RNA-binding Zn ribbon-like protein [Prauserella sediminis]MCR3719858.1 Conserved protein containing a Zn-ribbon-like motif, possibly RNA-binding [Prauserella flava]MCR3736599.1 Conserved protein containing a Zn-ribbon-like motif, possibly RNA-binding [Prauserella salsuginis]
MHFSFVSGDPALDLAATIGYRRTEPVDLVQGPADLERWVRACEELPAEIAADLESFDAAITLREAVYSLALARTRGHPFDPGDVEVLNAAANGPALALELVNDGMCITGGIRAALAHVARSGITVLADATTPIKECARPECTRLYLDRSRGARRTWCGMAECGNRVKAAAYRARRRAAG